MAKKKPNVNNLRQGQTIYLSSVIRINNLRKYIGIVSQIIINHEKPNLKSGLKKSVRLSRVVEFMNDSGNCNLHSSRNKAQRGADALAREYGGSIDENP